MALATLATSGAAVLFDDAVVVVDVDEDDDEEDEDEDDEEEEDDDAALVLDGDELSDDIGEVVTELAHLVMLPFVGALLLLLVLLL